LITAKISASTRRNFYLQHQCYKVGVLKPTIWSKNGRRLTKMAKAKFFSLNSLTGPSTINLIWKMMTTQTTSKIFRANNAQVKVKTLRRVMQKRLLTVKSTTFGGNLRRNYHGEIHLLIKPNETSFGTVST